MKSTVTVYDFRQAFHNMGRGEQFTYEGLGALFEWLENYEEETGQEVELDVIALCCDFTEYEDLEEFQRDYGEEYETIEDIENNTTVIRVGVDGFIIQAF